MNLTSLSTTAMVLLAAALFHGTEARREEKQRAACYELADHISRRMQDMPSKADPHFSGGKGTGEPESSRDNSGERLDTVLKGACDGSNDKEECYAVLGEQDGKIREWYRDARDRDFKEYVCDKQATGSDPSIMEAILRGKMKAEEEMAREAARNVEVEDEARKGKQQREQAQQQQQQQQQQQKKEAERKKQEPVKAKTEQQRESPSSATDPMAIIYGFINRFKNNMLRVKSLSIDLYGELSGPVKAKQWSRLGALLKSPAFYKKYWYAFLWYAIGLYLTFSIFESLLAKPKPRPERRSGSKRKTAGTSAKRD